MNEEEFITKFYSCDDEEQFLKDVYHNLNCLKQENEQLKDNWNKLKEIAKSQSGFKKRADLKGGLWFEIDDLLDKMQEMEKNYGKNYKNLQRKKTEAQVIL